MSIDIASNLSLITPQIGAVLENVCADPDDGESVDAIRNALDHHHVVVLRNQSFTATSLRDFVAQFGPLFLHHSDDGVIPVEGVPEVLRMLKEPDGTRLFGGGDWHADVTFRNPAAMVSALYAIEIPPVGGDTLFASTVAAFSALSSGMQDMLRELSAVHSYSGRGQPQHPAESAVHPVVRAHPVTGHEGLYVNRMFTTRFVGMTTAESEPIIDFIDRHVSRPEFCCRVAWREGQLVLWDNRFSLHYPSNDFTGHRRELIRCTAMEA